jgi:hypothetical protein
MKNITLLAILAILVGLGFGSCQKRPLGHITIYGSVIDSSGASLQAKIELWTGAPPAETGSTKFGEISTENDGTFTIRSNAGWNSSSYYLWIKVNGTSKRWSKKYFVAKNESLDVGQIVL